MRMITASEAREMREAATPGPWRCFLEHWIGKCHVSTAVLGKSCDGELAPLVATPNPRDARLIAAAPDLAHTVEVLEAERDALQLRVVIAEEEDIPVLRRSLALVSDLHLATCAALATAGHLHVPGRPLADRVAALAAERDEARAALAEAQAEILALRGLPEGAIGSAWVFDDGGRRAHWSQITSRTMMRVWPDGSWRAGGTTPGSQFVSGDEGSIRAGMRAAQAATDDVLSCGGW